MQQVEALGVLPAADTPAGSQLLGGSSVIPKVEVWFLLATGWAAVFQRVRYLVLFSLFFLKQLFKKFWGYPFEDSGGGFCNYYLRGTLLAMVGSRGPSDCIDCDVATGFRESSTPWSRS